MRSADFENVTCTYETTAIYSRKEKLVMFTHYLVTAAALFEERVPWQIRFGYYDNRSLRESALN